MFSVESKEDGDFEIIDPANCRWFKQVFKDLTKASASKQIVVGGVSGW